MNSTFVSFPSFHPPPWVIRCFTNMVSQDVSVKTGYDWKYCSDKTENTACFVGKNSTNLNVGLLSQMTEESFSEQLCLINCWYCHYSDFQAEAFQRTEQFPIHCVLLFGAS